MKDSRVAGTTVRLVVLAICFFVTAGLAADALKPEITPLRSPLWSMPRAIGTWVGKDAEPFTPEVMDALGVDDYINRGYFSHAEPPVALYVGYYESQRTGDTIHSPQNCLPGAGWLPVRTSRIDLRVPGRAEPITVNSLLIQKGLERQVVLYWYQSHGRVVASDYLSKAYLVYDAARHRRSDAAMVRVISPVGPADTSDRETEARAARFIQAMFPDLERLLPI